MKTNHIIEIPKHPKQYGKNNVNIAKSYFAGKLRRLFTKNNLNDIGLIAMSVVVGANIGAMIITGSSSYMSRATFQDSNLIAVNAITKIVAAFVASTLSVSIYALGKSYEKNNFNRHKYICDL